MPLQIAPGTAPEPSFDHLAALAMGGAPHAPGAAVHPTETPAAAHRQRDDLTSDPTDSLDNLAKHFDALAKAGFKGADPKEITKLLKGLHSDLRTGRSTGDNARKATEEVESLFHKLSNEFHFMSDDQIRAGIDSSPSTPPSGYGLDALRGLRHKSDEAPAQPRAGAGRGDAATHSWASSPLP